MRVLRITIEVNEDSAGSVLADLVDKVNDFNIEVVVDAPAASRAFAPSRKTFELNPSNIVSRKKDFTREQAYEGLLNHLRNVGNGEIVSLDSLRRFMMGLGYAKTGIYPFLQKAVEAGVVGKLGNGQYIIKMGNE